MVSQEKVKNNYFDGLPVHSKQIVLYIIIVAAYFFEQVDNAILGYVAPAVMKTFGIGMAEFAPVQSVYFIGMMLGGLLGGIISDFVGRRRAFLGSILVFSIACILNGFTNNLTIFIVSRAITGLGIFSMMVVSVTYLAEISPAESRAKWQGLCAGFGFCAAPLVGVVATKVVPMGPETWRYIFYFGGFGLAAFMIGLFRLKESPRWLVQKGRVAEAEAIVESLTDVPVDLSEAQAALQKKDCGEKIKITEILTGMFRGKYLRRTVVCAIIIMGANVPAFILMGWNPTLLQMNGLSETSSLLVTTIGAIGSPIGVFLSSYLGDKGGRKIPIGVLGLLYGAFLLIYVHVGNNPYLLAFMLFCIQIMGMCATFIIMPYLAESFPTQMRNTASGALNAFGRLCVSGAQLMVPLIYAATGFSGLGAFMAAFSIASAAAALGFGWRTGGRSLEAVC